jgi:hypothetical protein
LSKIKLITLKETLQQALKHGLIELSNEIFEISNAEEFEKIAFRIFRIQYQSNNIYKQYVDLLKINPDKVSKLTQIPFLPIDFFKQARILAGGVYEEMVFYSSGTTSNQPSRHFIADIGLYKKSFITCFTKFYGNPQKYCILALLPGYMERSGSSLVYMVNELMNISGNPHNGFYLNEIATLKSKINLLESTGQAYILIGVTYALLDFANTYPAKIEHGIIMETGGMKGKRKELIKKEVHEILESGFGKQPVHSEYGMTELLSQAYSKGNGLYECPPWMNVLIRDTYDPFSYVETEGSGGINVIDFANLYSCCFIETKDLGKLHPNGMFEVLGRYDHSEIRGCNLMIS